MTDPLQELTDSLEGLKKSSASRCGCEIISGQRCDWHRADYLGAPRCGWAKFPLKEAPQNPSTQGS